MFFFNDTATTEIYTLSLHDALPICASRRTVDSGCCGEGTGTADGCAGSVARSAIVLWQHVVGDGDVCVAANNAASRSEEHTSELQSHVNLVCRLLLEKKKKKEKND